MSALNGDIRNYLMAMQWGKCKGELNALVAMSGAYPSTCESNYELLDHEVNNFIKKVDEEELWQ